MMGPKPSNGLAGRELSDARVKLHRLLEARECVHGDEREAITQLIVEVQDEIARLRARKSVVRAGS